MAILNKSAVVYLNHCCLYVLVDVHIELTSRVVITQVSSAVAMVNIYIDRMTLNSKRPLLNRTCTMNS